MHVMQFIDGYPRDVRAEIDAAFDGRSTLSPVEFGELLGLTPDLAQDAREWRMHDDVEDAVDKATDLPLAVGDPSLISSERAWMTVLEMALGGLVRSKGEDVVRAMLAELAASREKLIVEREADGTVTDVVLGCRSSRARDDVGTV